MNAAVLQIFAPLSPAFRRQTFREARVDGIEVHGYSRPLRPAEMDTEIIVVTLHAGEVELLGNDEDFYRC